MERKNGIRAQAQVVVNQANGQIICTACVLGRVHDFRLFKQHRIPMLPEQLCLADKGYQGMTKLHLSSCTPTKKPRQAMLNTAERYSQSSAGKAAGSG